MSCRKSEYTWRRVEHCEKQNSLREALLYLKEAEKLKPATGTTTDPQTNATNAINGSKNAELIVYIISENLFP